MKKILFKLIVKIWKALPFKLLLSKFIKKSDYLKHKLYKDLRYKGVIKVKLPNNSFKLYNPGFTTIENEIFWNGIEKGWEKNSLKLWREFAKKSSVILDIGANSGIYSLVAHSVNPKATIHAFEPVERTFELLNENIQLNIPNNIHLHQKAVSNSSGIATFYDVKNKSQYSASLNESMISDTENRISYDVEVISLDDYCPVNNLTIDLIKLDIEMHEPEALGGMKTIIKRDRPILLIEILTEEIGSKVMSFFHQLDYQYFNIDEKKGIIQVKEIIKPSACNYLLLPSESYNKVKNIVQ